MKTNSDNSLAPNRQQALALTNDDRIPWRILCHTHQAQCAEIFVPERNMDSIRDFSFHRMFVIVFFIRISFMFVCSYRGFLWQVNNDWRNGLAPKRRQAISEQWCSNSMTNTPLGIMCELGTGGDSEWTHFWSLRWRHNECDSVSNHQLHNRLLNRLSGRRSK